MKQLTTRQAKLLMMFYIVISKVMMLPSMISSAVTNDTWLVFILLFGFEFLFLILILNINKKNPDLTFNQALEKVFGKIIVKIFYFLIGLVFLLKLAVQYHEAYIYFFEVLYTEFSWLVFLIPVVIYVGYVSTRNLRNFGRNIELFGYVIMGCVIIALVDAISNVNIINLFPILNNPAKDILNSSFNFCLWFGDFLILFIILGNIKYEKSTNKEIIKGWVMGMIATMLVVIFFYSVFGRISPIRRIALIDITQYSPRLNINGSFVWVVCALWPVAIFFQLGFLSFVTCESFSVTFNAKNNYRINLSFIVVILTLFILIITNLRLTQLIGLIQGGLKYFVFVVQYLVVLLIVPLSVIPLKRRKQYD